MWVNYEDIEYYTELDEVDEMLEDDEIDASEAAFMRGWYAAGK